MFADKLIDSIKEKGNNPTIIGLDPTLEYIPDGIKTKYFEKYHDDRLKAAGKAMFEFNKGIIDSTYDLVAAVKPQLAYYEMYGINGLKAYLKTIQYCNEKGLLVVTDGKRNDIGSTASAYSAAYLEENALFESDALTVNGYLGIDGIKPFIDDCEDYDKGIFVLVKTSNKSSGDIQDLELGDGRKIYELNSKS